MGFADEQLARLKTVDLESIPRVQALGDLNFSTTVPTIRTILQASSAVNDVPEVDLPATVKMNVPGLISETVGLVDRMTALTLTDPNAPTERQAVLQRLEEIRDWFALNVRPVVNSSGVNTVAMASEAEEALRRAGEAQARAEELISRLSRLAGRSAAGTLSGYYQEQTETHRKRARNFLISAAVAAAITVVVAIVLFTSLKVDTQASNGTQWAELVRNILVRVFFLSLLGFAISFNLKGYRANAHALSVCEQKRNALDTYGLFSESVDDDARAVITAELVRHVFSSSSTGYENEGVEERTIVENSSPLLGLLARGPK